VVAAAFRLRDGLRQEGKRYALAFYGTAEAVP
jgi:hypothetical protein